MPSQPPQGRPDLVTTGGSLEEEGSFQRTPPCVCTRSTAPGPSYPHVLRLAALPPGLQLSVPVGPEPAYSQLPSCIPPDSQSAGESTNKLQMCLCGVAGGTVLETTGKTGTSPHPPSTPTHRRGRRLSRETRGHEVSLGVGLQGRSSRSTEGCVGWLGGKGSDRRG